MDGSPPSTESEPLSCISDHGTGDRVHECMQLSMDKPGHGKAPPSMILSNPWFAYNIIQFMIIDSSAICIFCSMCGCQMIMKNRSRDRKILWSGGDNLVRRLQAQTPIASWANRPLSHSIDFCPVLGPGLFTR